MVSKWSIYDGRIRTILQENDVISVSDIAKRILNTELSARKSKEVDQLRTYISRNTKRILDQHEGVYKATDDVDVPNTAVKHLWIKTKESSVFIKNPNYVEQEIQNFEELSVRLIEDLRKYSPNFQIIDREINNNSHLLIIDPADIHIGKLCSAFEVGERYDNQIAVMRVIEGVRGILNKTASYKFDKIILVGGNDILHIDNPKRTTTSGTPQDTDGMWHSNFLIAKQLYVDIIEILLTVADVHFMYNPSNHDYTNGYFLANVIETYFRNCPNVTFDTSISHRKYYTYHNNLIGTTHGDGAKTDQLPLLMAHESKDWSSCKHKYIYTHHLHHKIAKDYMGVCVESLRSPSGTDSWHHRNGYEHAPKAIEAFIHDKNHGQIARIMHVF